jgi:hypothetical protein
VAEPQRRRACNLRHSKDPARLLHYIFPWRPPTSVAAHARALTFSRLSGSGPCRFKVERYMQVVFGLSACCLFVPVLYHQTSTQDAPADAE